MSNVVAISSSCLALKSDGTVVGWGLRGDANILAGLSNIVAIAAGIRSSLAINKRGGVVEWGVGGDLEDTPSGISNILKRPTNGTLYIHLARLP